MLTLLAAALLFLALWVVVASPTLWLYPLSVGAPEVSPILLGLSVLLILVTLRKFSTRKLAIVLALAAAGLSAIPISKLSTVEREFDRELALVFPSGAPRALSGNMRPRPFIVRDLFMGIDPGQVRVDRSLHFASPDGLPLVLDVYRPLAPGRFPVLVQIYGSAWQRGNRTDNETFARYFANRGYVVFAIEYRHAPRSQWPVALDDTRAALAWIKAHGPSYEGDPSRLAIIGRSAGGHLALLAAYSGEARAVVSYYGPTDLTRGWREPPEPDPLGVRAILEAFLGGTPDAMPDRYREASPLMHVSAAVPPTLLVYGGRDHVVSPGFGRDLHAKLKEVGAKSVLLELPWAEHAFDTLPNGLSGQVALYYTERFLAAALVSGR